MSFFRKAYEWTGIKTSTKGVPLTYLLIITYTNLYSNRNPIEGKYFNAYPV